MESPISSTRRWTGKYRASAATSAGANHVPNGLPNQDAVRIYPANHLGPPLVLAPADGHGSPTHVLSEVGAQFAADASSEVYEVLRGKGFSKLIQPILAGRTLQIPRVQRLLGMELPLRIQSRWRELVTHDLERRRDPATGSYFREEELDGLGAKELLTLHKNPIVAYGSTLTVAAIGGRTVNDSRPFLFALRIGDGDVLTVSDSGDVSWVFG
ncbi:protein phosphatase 2C domain-containing protein, partial [Pirellulales bacterium]|nr:protein phosphatase 2C domain-containing protein [Pirellulales bacterium]